MTCVCMYCITIMDNPHGAWRLQSSLSRVQTKTCRAGNAYIQIQSLDTRSRYIHTGDSRQHVTYGCLIPFPLTQVSVGRSNFAALRAAVFPLSTKNLRGGRISTPVGARVKNEIFTLNPRRDGGRFYAPTLRFFANISKTATRSAVVFRMPVYTSFLHML